MSDPAALVTQQSRLPEETLPWGTLKWLCNAKLSPGAAQTFGICHIQPGCHNPLHYHPNCEEILYVLTGSGRHRLDAETVEIQAGATVRIPVGMKHQVENTGTQPLVCLIAFSSGNRETVFLE